MSDLAVYTAAYQTLQASLNQMQRKETRNFQQEYALIRQMDTELVAVFLTVEKDSPQSPTRPGIQAKFKP